MQVYKRSPGMVLRELFLALSALIIIDFVMSALNTNFLVMSLVSLGLLILFLYHFVFRWNVRFELRNDGRLHCYRNNWLEKEYRLQEYLAEYCGSSISLELIRISDGRKENLDCGPIGKTQAEQLYSDIQAHTAQNMDLRREGRG